MGPPVFVCDHVPGYVMSPPVTVSTLTRIMGPGIAWAVPRKPVRVNPPGESRVDAHLRGSRLDATHWRHAL